MKYKWFYFLSGLSILIFSIRIYNIGDIYWAGWFFIIGLSLMSAPIVYKFRK